jgi:hypothetical protein
MLRSLGRDLSYAPIFSAAIYQMHRCFGRDLSYASIFIYRFYCLFILVSGASLIRIYPRARFAKDVSLLTIWPKDAHRQGLGVN